MTTQPYEIIVAPATLYWAPTGSAFPAIAAVPGAPWVKIGTAGDRNYSGDGVKISHGQTIEQVRTLGSTGPVKAVRTQESLVIAVTLWDLLLAQYRLALNTNAVATTAAGTGTAGFKEVDVYRNVDVALLALLVRADVSPEGNGWNTQYEVPYCYESASPEVVYAKGAPAGLALEFTALEDPNAASAAKRFGRLVTQHQTAL